MQWQNTHTVPHFDCWQPITACWEGLTPLQWKKPKSLLALVFRQKKRATCVNRQMDNLTNERTRGYSHSHFFHHTSMIPLQHHCHMTNSIYHLQLAVKQTATKPQVRDWEGLKDLPGDDEPSTKFFVVTTSQIIKPGESEKVANLYRERGRGQPRSLNPT